jgi:hypothetical protein
LTLPKPGSENDAAGFLEEIFGSKGDDYISLLDVLLASLAYSADKGECTVKVKNKINLS